MLKGNDNRLLSVVLCGRVRHRLVFLSKNTFLFLPSKKQKPGRRFQATRLSLSQDPQLSVPAIMCRGGFIYFNFTSGMSCMSNCKIASGTICRFDTGDRVNRKTLSHSIIQKRVRALESSNKRSLWQAKGIEGVKYSGNV